MALDRDDKILKKITKLPSKKQFGDLAYSWLKERFPNAEDIMIRETRCELIGAPNHMWDVIYTWILGWRGYIW